MKHNNDLSHKKNPDNTVNLYRCQWTKQNTAGTIYLWASNLDEANRLVQPCQYTTTDIRLIEVPRRPIV